MGHILRVWILVHGLGIWISNPEVPSDWRGHLTNATKSLVASWEGRPRIGTRGSDELCARGSRRGGACFRLGLRA
jgi:hypothetical protein